MRRDVLFRNGARLPKYEKGVLGALTSDPEIQEPWVARRGAVTRAERDFGPIGAAGLLQGRELHARFAGDDAVYRFRYIVTSSGDGFEGLDRLDVKRRDGSHVVVLLGAMASQLVYVSLAAGKENTVEVNRLDDFGIQADEEAAPQEAK